MIQEPGLTRPDPIEVARAYGRAKSRQDIDAALGYCTEDFGLDCPPLGASSRGAAEVSADLARFFAMFPDYQFVCEGAAQSADGVVLWGRARMTWTGRVELPGTFGRIARLAKLPQRRVDVAATAVFSIAPSGLLASETFLFDGISLAEQLGVPASVFGVLR